MKTFKKEFINKALKGIGFKELTDVQKQVIPLIENKRDLIVEANTGSGKTHAFLVPIFESIDISKNEIQALILAPTRELAKQIHQFATEMANYSEEKINVDLYIGGSDKQNVIKKLSKGMPHIAIGTPGRVNDLAIKENVLKIYTAKHFVIDEADMTLDSNFLDEVSSILSTIDNKAIKTVFSATIPQALKPFLKKYLRNPEIINVHPKDISSLNINHFFIKTREQNRFNTLTKLIGALNPYLAIIFCNTKESSELVYEWMKEKKQNVTLIHGGLDYRKRKQLMKRINKLEFQYIVATDIFSRGIDVLGVSHIINYELPRNIEFYIHRTGRTGRVDFDGIAISMYEFDDNKYLDKLESKGIKSVYKDISNGVLKDAIMRSARAKREWKENELDYAAKARINKPKKVKPGYKKKYKLAVEEEKKKIHKKRRRK
ncbi:MAG: DEAD/DEAH box helicase [Tenericutes bacterium]|nr:DEAD/DEAH box helicase [Mycoplasmatota bacterium]